MTYKAFEVRTCPHCTNPFRSRADQGEFKRHVENCVDDGVKRTHLPRNIETGFVVGGWRHHNCLTALADLGRPKGAKVQGFLTSEGRFLDRVAAAEVALVAGQVDEIPRLFESYHLY